MESRARIRWERIKSVNDVSADTLCVLPSVAHDPVLHSTLNASPRGTLPFPDLRSFRLTRPRTARV